MHEKDAVGRRVGRKCSKTGKSYCPALQGQGQILALIWLFIDGVLIYEKTTIKKDAIEKASSDMADPCGPEKSRSLEEVRQSCARKGF